MDIYKILLVILVIFILSYIMNNKEELKEQFGSSDFFHRAFMSGIGLEQRKKDLKKIYDFYDLKENFETDIKEIEDIKEVKNLDKVVISDLPKNELKSSFELEDLKYDDQKHIIEEEVKLSEFEEVDSYNAGSGDIQELKKVYQEKEKDDFKKTLQMLDSRGGNVH